MRILFIHHVVADRGSAQDMHHYVQVARQLGHEVMLYGHSDGDSVFEYSVDVRPSGQVTPRGRAPR